jgi:putative DNA primase/helicase
MNDAATIARAYSGKPYGDGWIIRCPADGHGSGRGDKRPSCTIKDGDMQGRVLVHCFAGCEAGAILDALRTRGMISSADSLPETHRHLGSDRKPLPEPEPNPEALRIWLAARPLERTPAETYLREQRALTGALPPSLRFAYVKHQPTGLELPALVAAIARPTDRKIIAVQATFLTEQGRKAPFTTPRWTFGAMGTGAIRLAPVTDVIGIAEGAETALSATELTGIPCWSSVGAARLPNIAVPSTVKTVHIFGDNDAPGHVAAQRAADRHVREGRKVFVRFPPDGVGDYSDVLMARAGAVAA